jgi:hypothetical protein
LQEAEAAGTTVAGKYVFFPATSTGLAERSCGGPDLPEQIYYNSGNTRQSKLIQKCKLTPTYENLTQNYTVTIVADVKGIAKKKVLGSWVEYSTTQELEWDFEVDIVNENSLPTGVVINRLTKLHSGTRSENGKYTAYWNEYFWASNVPNSLMNYAQPVWERVTDNRHRTGGITPNWNIYSCQ